MWSKKKHFNFIQEANIHEKLYCAVDYDFKNQYPFYITMKAQLANTSANKTFLLANRILMERAIGQKLMYVQSRKNQTAFNLPEGAQFGFIVDVRSDQMYFFLEYFMLYSLRNLYNLHCLLMDKRLGKSRHAGKEVLDILNFGLTKLLFFMCLSESKDWNHFSQVYDSAFYGIDFQINTTTDHPLVNKVLLSHHCLGIL